MEPQKLPYRLMTGNLEMQLASMSMFHNSARAGLEKPVLEIMLIGLTAAAIWKKFMKLANLVKNAKMENAKSNAHQMLKEDVQRETRYTGLTAAAKKALCIMTAEGKI